MPFETPVRDLTSPLALNTPGPGIPKASTGIRGFDEITGGGLPLGRTTLVVGAAGAGKTLFGLEFLVTGARQLGEPGVSANAGSLGFDIDGLQAGHMLVVHAFQVEPSEIVNTGEFDFEPLFLLLADTIGRIGAKRVVLDTIEVLFGAFRDETTVRAELSRLFRWLEEQGVTAIVTAERGEKELTRHGIEEYVSDCVVLLDHRVHEEISTRRLRVVKYRGSAHGTNEYPFLISPHGLVVLPITSMSLDYGASEERISTGMARLDHMLAGGLFRGSTVLVSGMAGTGKTTLGASLVDSACARGERALMVLFEESPDQFIRNMGSVGFDLRHWVGTGLLHVWAARPSALGSETHLAMLAELIEEVRPSVAVLDGVVNGAFSADMSSLMGRKIDLLKSRGVTTLVTMLANEDQSRELGVSSLMDTWLLLRNVESNGERNRLLFVIKSRGSAHSNQVREFLLTDGGIDLIDVYVGPEGVLTGSARQAQEARQRDAGLQRGADLVRRQRELRRSIVEGEGRLNAMEDEIAGARAEIERIDTQELREMTDTAADRVAMSSRRWADPELADAGGRP